MMMNLLICGSNFQTEEQDDELFPSSANSSPSSTPRRSRLFCKSNNINRDKNPYATRGLDKFSALLADLEEKRQKIYAENGTAQDISFVRFVYKNSNDLVPVVVKLKDNNNKSKNNKNKKELMKTKSFINCTDVNKEETKDTHQSQSSSDQTKPQDKFSIETSVAVKEAAIKRSPKKIFSWRSVKWDRLRKPSYYLPVVVLIILLLLTVFGRSVAILCTSIGWYVVPALKETASAKKRTSATKIVKKDYVKRLSDKRMVSEGIVSSPRVHNNKSTLS